MTLEYDGLCIFLLPWNGDYGGNGIFISLPVSRASSQLMRWDPLFFFLLFPCGPLPLLYMKWGEHSGICGNLLKFYNLNWLFKFRQQHSGYLTDTFEFPMAVSTHLLFISTQFIKRLFSRSQGFVESCCWQNFWKEEKKCKE